MASLKIKVFKDIAEVREFVFSLPRDQRVIHQRQGFHTILLLLDSRGLTTSLKQGYRAKDLMYTLSNESSYPEEHFHVYFTEFICGGELNTYNPFPLRLISVV